MLLICTICYVFCYEVLILQRAPHILYVKMLPYEGFEDTPDYFDKVGWMD